MPGRRLGVQVAVEGYGVVEDGYIPEVELTGQDSLVGTLRCCHDCRHRVPSVLAVVDYVVEVEDQVLAGLVSVHLLLVMGRGQVRIGEEQC